MKKGEGGGQMCVESSVHLASGAQGALRDGDMGCDMGAGWGDVGAGWSAAQRAQRAQHAQRACMHARPCTPRALHPARSRPNAQPAHALPPLLPPPTNPQRGYKVRALSRSGDKVQQLFGGAPGLSVALADLREPSSLPAALEGVDAVVCATGTTAFPSKRCAFAASRRRVQWLGPCGHMRSMVQQAQRRRWRPGVFKVCGVCGA